MYRHTNLTTHLEKDHYLIKLFSYHLKCVVDSRLNSEWLKWSHATGITNVSQINYMYCFLQCIASEDKK